MSKQKMLHYLDTRAQDFYALSDKICDNAEVRFWYPVKKTDNNFEF